MTKAWLTFWAAVATVIAALITWRNFQLYRERTFWWKLAKTAIDLALTLATAWFLPPLLIGWVVYWFVRPMKSGSGKVTTAILAGMFFGSIALQCMELIAVLGAFSIDLITGRNGFLRNRARAEYELRLKEAQAR